MSILTTRMAELRRTVHGVTDAAAAAYLRGYDRARAEAAAANIADPVLAFKVRTAADPIGVLRHEFSESERALAELEFRKSDLMKDAARLERLEQAFADLVVWGERAMRIEAVTESVVHKINDSTVLSPRVEKPERTPWEVDQYLRAGCEVFLVQHDWASLLANADVDAGTVRLPYERCCFEFQISEKRFCILIECIDGEPAALNMFIRVKGGWLYGDAYTPDGDGWSAKNEGDTFSGIVKIVWDQIRAIAITLDAGVTVHHVERAPHLLNAQRERRGQLPKFDHHIVSLAPKTKAARLPRAGEPKYHVRLHFRRGHWRHYETHKTWIRWMLVGNAELGFVAKDYAA